MDATWTTLKVLTWTTERFAKAGFDNPRLEAQVVVAHGLGFSRMGLFTNYDKPLGDAELAACRQLIQRRLGGEPAAYITGEREFWSLGLVVDRRVLIPRPDTETLVQVALELFPKRAGALLELGTGSGAVAIALATERPQTSWVATDVSSDALEVARENVERHGLSERVELRHGDLFAALADGERFDGIVSNPPYIPAGDLGGLDKEVQKEPRGALDGGADGLQVIVRIAREAPTRLLPGGFLALEHGFNQAEEVRGILSASGFTDVGTADDLAGIGRVTHGRLRLD